MAIRYSGDVEVRMLHKGGTRFDVVVRTPRDRWAGTIQNGQRLRVVTPEDYDHVALTLLTVFDRRNPGTFPVERDPKRGHVTIRRVFQAPCPVGR